MLTTLSSSTVLMLRNGDGVLEGLDCYTVDGVMGRCDESSSNSLWQADMYE